MKSLIIYSSQTGFTKKYAEWLAESLECEAIDYDKAKTMTDDQFAPYDSLVYGGWANAGKIVKADWFLAKASAWKDKKIALYCVGAAKMGDPLMENTLSKLLNEEQKKYIKVFYCTGGIDYSKMKLSHKLAMKAYAAMLKKDKDPEKHAYGEQISGSFDATDRKYTEPILEYVRS